MISIVTPSVRPEMLDIVSKCLQRQTNQDYEWIVISPFAYLNIKKGYWIKDPDKRVEDYYSLNKAWNAGFKIAKGDLFVSIVDGLWFPPDTLEKLWFHYENNPKAIVGGVGNQYDQLIRGKPEHEVWRDPRMRTDQGSFYEVEPTEIEWCLTSIPRKAIYDIGGMDEEFDKGAALSEKDANLRMQKAGYSLYLDQSLEYRAIHHPRLSPDWDEKYKIAIELWKKSVHDIMEGKRLKLNYL